MGIIMLNDLKKRRAWVEVDLDAIEYNYNAIKSVIDPKTKLCCVVKADAYGHGAVVLSKEYERLGADMLAVSNIEEALQLRSGGIGLPILILGYTSPECAKELAENSIIQCVFSKDYGKALSESAVSLGVKVRVHIKIDTGMGRIGFSHKIGEGLDELSDALMTAQLEGLLVEGVFSHFASADEGVGGAEYTLKQYKAFLEVVESFNAEKNPVKLFHIANSAAIYDYPEMQLDMVRAGIVLYGLAPSGELSNMPRLRPAMKLKTVIDRITTLAKGDFVSYGREFEASGGERVATIPIGYADGLLRSSSRAGLTLDINGSPAEIVGRVCMDQCMILIHDENLCVGDEVTVYGGLTSVDDVARLCGTINYEIVCSVGARVPRAYYKNGKLVGIYDNII